MAPLAPPVQSGDAGLKNGLKAAFNTNGLDESQKPGVTGEDSTAEADAEPEAIKKTLTNGVSEPRAEETGKLETKKKSKSLDTDENVADDDDLSTDDGSIEDTSKLLGMKNKAPGRIRQFGQYLRMMEARMIEMETELAKLKGEDVKKPEESPVEDDKPKTDEEDKDKKGEPICEIKTGDMDFFDRIVDDDGSLPDFHSLLDSKRKRSNQKWVIEVMTRSGMAAYTQLNRVGEAAATDEDKKDTSDQQQDGDTSQSGKVQYPERVRIRSDVLLSYLSQLAKGDNDSFGTTLMFLAPFKLFVRNEEKIRKRLQELELAANKKEPDDEPAKGDTKDDEKKKKKKSEEDKEKERKLLSHMRLLVQLLDTLLQPTIQVARSMREKTATHVSFEHLYYLFNYGQEILCADGTNQVYRVYGFTGGRDVLVPRDDDDWQPGFIIDSYQYASNGQSYGPLARQFVISRFYGQRDIRSLPVYPLHCDPRADELRKEIETRGKLYIELSSKDKVVHRQYTGTSLDMPPEEIDSQVIIDQFMAIRHNQDFNQDFGVRNMTSYNDRETASRCTCSPNCTAATYRDFHQDNEDDKAQALEYFSSHKHALQPPSDLTEPYEEDRILLPQHVYGFALRSRKWAKMKLEVIRDIEYKNTFDRLVLPRGHAESVRALVLNHSRGPSTNDDQHVEVAMDLVRGKGKGLIILLHGEPGVGKTSTAGKSTVLQALNVAVTDNVAECIADYTKRPLYPITCGDIGSQAEKVEANLERTFQLAHKWGCVLLLDEADVFLQERTREDIERNAIVSVFLRNMEYYSGILFLTTNRVGTLDQAFRSRIHLSLYYPALDEDATIKIWKMHIETAKLIFKDSSRDIIIDKDDILAFARDHYREMEATNSTTWNGRQIRNAFQTAIALAEMDATIAKGNPHLKGKQFEVVAKTSQDFDDYLRLTQGGTSARLAKQHKLRHDEFKSRNEKAGSSKKAPPAKSSKKKKKVVIESSSSEGSSSEESSSSEEEVVVKKKAKSSSKKDKGKKKVKQESTEEESSEEAEPVKEKKKKSKRGE